MDEEQLKLAALHFAEIPDPRIERSRQHPLVNVIVIALCAVMAEAESFYDIEAFGKIKRVWLSQFLDLKNGIPSHDTFTRVFARLEPMHFQACFLTWVREAIGGRLSAGDVVSIITGSACAASFCASVSAPPMRKSASIRNRCMLSSLSSELLPAGAKLAPMHMRVFSGSFITPTDP